ncbi:MAG: hypothetical protein JWP14_2429 [Frankiales bacterium]|nr:hypothetical protein [Frankiales bacterium]
MHAQPDVDCYRGEQHPKSINLAKFSGLMRAKVIARDALDADDEDLIGLVVVDLTGLFRQPADMTASWSAVSGSLAQTLVIQKVLKHLSRHHLRKVAPDDR